MIKLKIITSVIFPNETKEEDIDAIVTKYSAEKTTNTVTLPDGKTVTITTFTMEGSFIDASKIVTDCKKLNGLITGQRTEPINE